jgi:beta-1,4-mannosyltransferase
MTNFIDKPNSPIRILAEPGFKNRSINPYNWLLYSNMEKLGAFVDDYHFSGILNNRYNIWHLHWPELVLYEKNTLKVVLKLILFFSRLIFSKLLGTKVVWTVHNLAAHEQYHPKLEKLFWHFFAQFLDGYITLSEIGKQTAQQKFPYLSRLPGFVIPHGHYIDEYENCVTPHDARIKLCISDTSKVILFFGRIRPYKNILELLQAFRLYPDANVILCIAGCSDIPELKDEIISKANLDPRVRLHLDFIPKDEVQLYFKACNLVVLPYQEILNSGSALLALSFDKPILVPRRGALGELQMQVGDAWVNTYTEALSPGHLSDALRWASKIPRTKPFLECLGWPALAQQTLDAYQFLINPQYSEQLELYERN